MLEVRVWDEYENKMYFSASINKEFYLKYDSKLGLKAYKKSDESYPLIMMLYTGLRDKNGKKIYVGDIIKIDDLESLHWQLRGEIGEVRYIKEKSGYFIMVSRYTRNRLLEEDCNILEVIGDKYRNPKLL